MKKRNDEPGESIGLLVDGWCHKENKDIDGRKFDEWNKKMVGW